MLRLRKQNELDVNLENAETSKAGTGKFDKSRSALPLAWLAANANDANGCRNESAVSVRARLCVSQDITEDAQKQNKGDMSGVLPGNHAPR